MRSRAVFLERVISVLGGAGISGAALAQRFDGGIEVLRRDPRAGENLSRLGILLERKSEQHPLDGDEAVAGLFRDLLRLIEYPRQGRRQVNLPGAAARDFRELGKRRLDCGQRFARAAAGTIDQARGEPFRVVEQDLEQMLRCELLVALAQGQRLGGLNEAAGAVRVFLKIHFISLGLPLRPCGAE